jgi:hypothetical protein
MEPNQYPQCTNLHRTGRHDLHVQEIGVVVGGNVGGPNGPGSGKQASEEFFRANPQEELPFFGLAGRLGAGDVTIASLVPIDEVATLVHCFQSATQRPLEATLRA